MPCFNASNKACDPLVYKRIDVAIMAFGVQTATVLIFYLALCIFLTSSLNEVDEFDLSSRVLGFDSIERFLATMIAISFLGLFVMFTLYQAVITGKNLQFFRLSASGQYQGSLPS
eukprot:118367-Prymnesium_polylepis.2